MGGAEPSSSLSHRCPGLRAHRDVLQNALTQSCGRTTGGAQLQQQYTPSVQSGHPAPYGQQKRCLHPDTIPSIPSTVGSNFAKYEGASNGMDNHNCYRQRLSAWSSREHFRVGSSPAPSADHIPVGGISDNPPVTEALTWISETTRRDTLDREAVERPQVVPVVGLTGGVSHKGVL